MLDNDLVIRYSYKSYQLNYSLLAVYLIWISASYISNQMLVSYFFVTCSQFPDPLLYPFSIRQAEMELLDNFWLFQEPTAKKRID